MPTQQEINRKARLEELKKGARKKSLKKKTAEKGAEQAAKMAGRAVGVPGFVSKRAVGFALRHKLMALAGGGILVFLGITLFIVATVVVLLVSIIVSIF